MGDLKYSYALNSSKTSLVHIGDAKQGEDYYCPYSNCGERLIIKDGGNRRKHFSHIKNSTKCSYNNYLHSLAERKIAEWFNSVNAITIELVTDVYCAYYNNCVWRNNNEALSCKRKRLCSYDLKTYYNKIEIEKSEHGFRWDLWLTNTNKDYTPMAIEIKVTHECDINKTSSGYKIIEIEIENEEQLDKLVSSNKLIRNDKITFFNFNPKPQYDQNIMKYTLNKFILYDNMRAGFKVVDCGMLLKRDNRAIYELTFNYYVSTNTYEKVFNAFYLACAWASQKFPNFKHCSLCKNYRYNDSHSQYICILYKILKLQDKHDGSNAITCPKYYLNNEYVKNNIKCLSLLSLHEWIKEVK